MGLLIFSERTHVVPIARGEKTQTTRPRRKIPFKPDETLHCYFKSRMTKGTCFNCIRLDCPRENNDVKASLRISLRAMIKETGCELWTNFYGKTNVLSIEHYWDEDHWRVDTVDELYYKRFSDMILDPHFEAILEEWAIADGFPEGFKQANAWFTLNYGKGWANNEFDVVKFNPFGKKKNQGFNLKRKPRLFLFSSRSEKIN